MSGVSLTSKTVGGVTLLGDWSRPGGVTFAFTERGGGVSEGPYASLNLGSRCGDDPACVAENRRRALEALGAEAYVERLVCPRQVHGDHVTVVRDASKPALAAARAEAEAGSDAVVCTAPGVPVLLCFADCVPVVLAAPGAFAVAHSGWRGTLARIAATALEALCSEARCTPAEVCAYVGPCIGQADYEVSSDLAERFAAEFGTWCVGEGNTLDLGAVVEATLRGAGVPAEDIARVDASTARSLDRFYSYRAEGGHCGRHGALACLVSER